MKILVAPLNWGLGHATRCIPIIEHYLSENHEVHIASDGLALQLLKKEFHNLVSFELPSYNVAYKNKNLIWGMFLQSFKILMAIKSENKKIAEIIEALNIDVLISDNRLGCFSKKTKSIYITHQLNLPIQNKLIKYFGNAVHRYFIKKYAECWIPDYQTFEKSLSGALSFPIPKTLTHKVKFIGPLSRFKVFETPKIYSIIIVLSGPEPQRTQFENMLAAQIRANQNEFLRHNNEKICFVRGTESINASLNFDLNKVEIYNLLASEILNTKILQSHYYIGRSGYTTLMDVIKLQKRAILVPTPGQFEQEYLANFHRINPDFYTTSQENFDIKIALDSIKSSSNQQ